MEGKEQYAEINMLDYLKVIWKHRNLIAIITLCGAAATALVSLFMAPVYESKAVLIPAGVLSKDQGASTAFLAMQFGIAPPTTPASVEIVNLLKSKSCARSSSKSTTFFRFSSRGKRCGARRRTELEWKGLRYLQKHMIVTFTQKDNLITLAFQYSDPNKTAEIVGYMLGELNDHMSGEAKRVADTNRHYLEAQLDKTADPFIKAKLYALIAQQIETSVMAEVKENFSFKVLDPPRVPDKRIKPKRTSMVLIAFLLSLIAGVFAAFIFDGRTIRERSNMKDETGRYVT